MTRWRLLLVLVLVAVASALALRFVLDGQARKPAPMACYGWNAADPSCRFVDSLVRKLGPRQYSQGFEELIIRDFLGDRRDGFFLDVGSSHYKDDSTTLLLEERFGWKGIAIDANADYRDGYVQFRPGTRFVSFFVSDVSDEVGELTIVESAPKNSTGVPEQARQIREAAGAGGVRDVQVPTITLNALLAREKVAKVDFLSLDIEGYEPKALAGFDIERFRPDLACVEVKPPTEEAIEGYFAAHGYVEIPKYRGIDPSNRYYAPKDSISADATP
jgi:FkbM family methyltransferase